MRFTVTVRGREQTLSVETGQTILAAALSQGMDYPHGCQAGNCGACKSRLHSGQVDMMPYSEYALPAEQARLGLILACRALPASDAEVEPVDAEPLP